MFRNTIISALVLSVAIFSAQSPAQASINPETTVYIQADNSVNLANFNIGFQRETSAAFSTNVEPVRVAWSIVGAAKKVGRGIKNGAKATGRVIKRVNKKIVPSEIRNGASWTYKKTKAGVRYVAKNPYGKRCKPNKYLQPVCTVKGTGRRIVRDHRTVGPIVHDHRTGRRIVRDHRN